MTVFVCPPNAPREFHRHDIILVGFGVAVVLCDGKVVLDGEAHADEVQDGSLLLTGADAEKLATADPDHKWEIHLHGPLSEERYTRQPDGRWVLTEQGRGFA